MSDIRTPEKSLLINDPDVDLSQTTLLFKLVDYLKATYPSINMDDPDQKLDSAEKYTKSVIDQLQKYAKEGGCHGFTVLTMYAAHQYMKLPLPENGSSEIDDWSWLSQCEINLSKWNSDIKYLNSEDKENFSRLINHILLFQGDVSYELLGVGQPTIEKIFEDTAGNVMQKKYQLSGLFTKEDLSSDPPRQSKPSFVMGSRGIVTKKHQLEEKKENSREIETKKNDNREQILEVMTRSELPVMIASHNPNNKNKNDLRGHETGMIKHRDKYYFYDPNYQKGFREYTLEKLQEMSNDIFMANNRFDNQLIFSMGAYDFAKQENENNPEKRDSKIEFSPGSLLENTTLIRNNQDFTTWKSGENYQLIHDLAKMGDHLSLQFYFENGKNFIDMINDKDPYGFTPLHYAAFYGHIEVFNLLLEKKVDIHLKNNNESSALYMAAQHGHTEIVNLLLQKGADPNQVNQGGFTALDVAKHNHHPEVVKVLIKGGAQLGLFGKNDKKSVLKWAIVNKHMDIVELLITDKPLDSNKAEKLLKKSLKSGNLEMCKILKNRCPEVFSLDNLDNLQLVSAIKNHHTDVVKFMLDVGKEINDPGFKLVNKAKDDITPLMMALKKGYIDLAEILIAHGANINAIGNNGRTPLHFAVMYAVKKKDFSGVKLLLKQSNTLTTINSQDDDGNTPLSIAAREGNQELIQLLIEKGANRDIPMTFQF